MNTHGRDGSWGIFRGCRRIQRAGVGRYIEKAIALVLTTAASVQRRTAKRKTQVLPLAARRLPSPSRLPLPPPALLILSLCTPSAAGCNHKLCTPRGGVQRRAPCAVERRSVRLAHPASRARRQLPPAHATAGQRRRTSPTRDRVRSPPKRVRLEPQVCVCVCVCVCV